jgi:glycosyltransferase involved in cell wall biosynthesis
MSKRLILFINSAELFLSHRQHLARGAQAQGYDVIILVPPGPNVSTIRELGFRCETVKLGRKTVFPPLEILAVLELYFCLRRLRPDVLHSFTIKPVLYGTLVARLLRVKKIINTVTGLGFAFIDAGFKARTIRFVLGIAYKVIFRVPHIKFIFQNHDDHQFYIDNGWVKKEQTRLIPGTGVDTETFKPQQQRRGTEPSVLFAGRYLRDKGLAELIQAASELWQEGLRFRLILCGKIDAGNPNSFLQGHVEEWKRLPFVQDLGFQKVMAPVYAMGDIVCLPSYREGIPLTLIEASSAGKPMVATNVPGCREVVVDGDNGFLVEARASEGLKDALRKLLTNPELRSRFGARARELALKYYRKEILVEQGLSVYKETA